MDTKNQLVRVAFLLLLSALVIALAQYWGVTLKQLLTGMVASLLYGVLILAYLLRFGLVFLGVFALYRILRERHDRQLAA